MPTLHKKWNLPLRISSVNVAKSAVSCGFTEETLNGKLRYLCSAIDDWNAELVFPYMDQLLCILTLASVN